MSGKHKGRGRLSSIELLPEQADEAIAWANAQLREKKLPQTVILAEFNEQLADLGLDPISKGAFSRYSVAKARELRRLEANREITNAVLGRFDLSDRSASTLTLVEMIKSRILEMTMDAENITELDIDEMTQGLNRLSMVARREQQLRLAEKQDAAADEARRLEAEQREAEATAETVEKIAPEAGLGADHIAAIRKGVLGLAA